MRREGRHLPVDPIRAVYKCRNRRRSTGLGGRTFGCLADVPGARSRALGLTQTCAHMFTRVRHASRFPRRGVPRRSHVASDPTRFDAVHRLRHRLGRTGRRNRPERLANVVGSALRVVERDRLPAVFPSGPHRNLNTSHVRVVIDASCQKYQPFRGSVHAVCHSSNTIPDWTLDASRRAESHEH